MSGNVHVVLVYYYYSLLLLYTDETKIKVIYKPFVLDM